MILRSNNHHDEAARLLAYYIRPGWEAAGNTWDSDNDAEMLVIIDHISQMVESRGGEVDRPVRDITDELHEKLGYDPEQTLRDVADLNEGR